MQKIGKIDSTSTTHNVNKIKTTGLKRNKELIKKLQLPIFKERLFQN